MVKLVDTRDLKSRSLCCAGSIPAVGTMPKNVASVVRAKVERAKRRDNEEEEEEYKKEEEPVLEIHNMDNYSIRAWRLGLISASHHTDVRSLHEEIEYLEELLNLALTELENVQDIIKGL